MQISVCEGATEIGLISFANTIKNQILGRISSEKKKKIGNCFRL